MVPFAERRKYQRSTNVLCKVMFSKDEEHWNTIEVGDISAGGLSFFSYRPFEPNTQLYFDVCIYSMLSEFKFKLQGRVKTKRVTKNGFKYGIVFEELGKYKKIQLDELVKASCSVSTTERYGTEDGDYTFLLMPKVKPARFHIGKK